MKAYIWDLDGTLFDSYDEIASSMANTLSSFGIHKEIEEFYDFIFKHSVHQYLHMIEKEYSISYDALNKIFQEFHKKKYLEVKAEYHSKEILEFICSKGDRNFIFTHRESTTMPILKNLGLDSYFTEVISVEDGFARKPNPEALNYFIHKYHLDMDHTYYIGDRQLDMECAKNAHIQAILYVSKQSVPSSQFEDVTITDLLDVKDC